MLLAISSVCVFVCDSVCNFVFVCDFGIRLFSFVIFVSPTDADIGEVRAHAVEIHPGVTKIVVMALVLLGVGCYWALGCQIKENGWRGERRLILCL
jgi:hypothetical protein